jgi:phosphohistidine swiveling domain-containing protein
MSARPLPRLLPLGGELTPATGADGQAALAGAKAARLAAALAAGVAVLPGWVVPAAEAQPALAAGVAAVRRGQPAAARRAVLGHRLGDGLTAQLQEAAARLGGQVIVRSSSPLEGDPRWAGAFSTVTGVGPGDVASAVRSCWASAFAVDPLRRLEACGLPPEALALGVLLQPEIQLAAGGVARVSGTGTEVTVEGVRGHPGALLAGWADGESGERLAALLGGQTVAAVTQLATQAWQALGDDLIEWGAGDGGVWLLQSGRSAPATTRAAGPARPVPAPRPAPAAAADLLATREWMPLLAATVMDRGEHVRARPAAPGTAAGRLVPCRPHERPHDGHTDAILLVERPLPALAPLLFGTRGVIARSGAAGSHLAEVARSLGVPMVTGCRPELVTGGHPAMSGGWLAAIDGGGGDVALLGDWRI